MAKIKMPKGVKIVKVAPKPVEAPKEAVVEEKPAKPERKKKAE